MKVLSLFAQNGGMSKTTLSLVTTCAPVVDNRPVCGRGVLNYYRPTGSGSSPPTLR